MRRMSTTKQQEVFKYVSQNGSTTEVGGNLYVDGYSNTGSLQRIDERITTTDWSEDDNYIIKLPKNVNIHYMIFQCSIGTNIYIPLYLSGTGILFRQNTQSSPVLTPALISAGENMGWQGSNFNIDGVSIETGNDDNQIQFGKTEDEYLTDINITIIYSVDSDVTYEV